PFAVAADEKLLKEHGIATDGEGLVQFFRQRSLKEVKEHLEGWVRDLGSASFHKRQEATQQLIQRGAPALPFLKAALVHADLEVGRRAELCTRRIETGPGPALPAAAARLLAERKPPGALEVLLQHLPQSEDEIVEHEILASVAALGVREGHVHPL